MVEKIIYAKCDVRNYMEVKESLKDVSLVLHTAIIQIPQINNERKLAYEVNVIGTQNICKAVNENPSIKGVILAGTWHTFGEKELKGTVNEEFGFRPDKVEERARLYVLSKIAQESIVRLHDEMCEKIYAIIRMGTVLGQNMPKETAASIFINRGLRGQPITPYRHSMHRPMLYVDIKDVCKAFKVCSMKILNDKIEQRENSLEHIVNVYYPKPITILELAETVRESIVRLTHGEINPEIEIVDKGRPLLFRKEDKYEIKTDVSKAKTFLNLEFGRPDKTINRIIQSNLSTHFRESVRGKNLLETPIPVTAEKIT